MKSKHNSVFSNPTQMRNRSIYLLKDEADLDFEFFVFYDPEDISRRVGFMQELYQILFMNRDSQSRTFAMQEHKNELKRVLDVRKPGLITPYNWLKIAIERYPYRLFVVFDPARPGVEGGWQNEQGLTPLDAAFWYEESVCSENIPPSASEPTTNPPPTQREWIHSKFLYKRICWIDRAEVDRIFEGFETLQNTPEDAFRNVKDQTGKPLTRESYFKLWLHMKWVTHIARKIRRIKHRSLRVDCYNLSSISEQEERNQPYFTDTLPPFLRAEQPKIENEDLVIDLERGRLEIVSNTSENPGTMATILFRRHANTFRHYGEAGWQPEYPGYEDVFYGESLSGSLFYWTGFIEAVTNLARARSIRFMLSLIEQALMRLYLVDERIQEWYGFLKLERAGSMVQQRVFISYLEGPLKYNQKELPKHNLYAIIPTEKEGVSAQFSDEAFFQLISNNQTIDNRQDALIIHQGILDKWKSDKQNLLKVILDWKETVPFLVVTSGRGLPANLPAGVKFLPYSAVEACLSGSSFEKLTIVRQIYSLKKAEPA